MLTDGNCGVNQWLTQKRKTSFLPPSLALYQATSLESLKEFLYVYD